MIKGKVITLTAFLVVTVISLVSTVAAFLVDQGQLDPFGATVGYVEIELSAINIESSTDLDVSLTSPTYFYDNGVNDQFNDSVKKISVSVANNSNVDIRLSNISVVLETTANGVVYAICPTNTGTDYYQIISSALNSNGTLLSELKSALTTLNDATIASLRTERCNVGDQPITFDIYIWEEYYDQENNNVLSSSYANSTSIAEKNFTLAISVSAIQYDGVVEGE